MHPIILQLAQECVREIEAQLHRFDESMTSQAGRANWLGAHARILEEESCRETMRSMLRAELEAICVGIGTALDGATAMSDRGREVFLAGRDGELVEEGIGAGLGEYFEERLR